MLSRVNSTNNIRPNGRRNNFYKINSVQNIYNNKLTPNITTKSINAPLRSKDRQVDPSLFESNFRSGSATDRSKAHGEDNKKQVVKKKLTT